MGGKYWARLTIHTHCTCSLALPTQFSLGHFRRLTSPGERETTLLLLYMLSTALAAGGAWLQGVHGCSRCGAWLQGVHGCRGCMAAEGAWLQGVHGCRGCMAAGGAWLQGVHGCRGCMAAGGAWLQRVHGCRGCMAAGGVWLLQLRLCQHSGKSARKFSLATYIYPTHATLHRHTPHSIDTCHTPQTHTTLHRHTPHSIDTHHTP